MNQVLRILAISLFTANLALAQEGKVELGIEGGPNVAFMYVRNNPNFNYYNPRILGSGAFAFEYHFSNLISLRSAFGYEAKGYQRPFQIYANGTDLGISTIYSKFNYLTLPILMRLNFGTKVRFFVNAGPYLGYLMSKKNRISEYEEYSGDALSGSLLSYNRFDFGISGGLGIGIPINENWSISLEARYNLGLLPAKTDNDGTVFTNSSNLLAGISYRLKPRSESPKDRSTKNSFSPENRITLGLEVGPNSSSFMESRPYTNGNAGHSAIQPRLGYTAGLSLQFNCRRHFSLRTGILYQKNEYSFGTGYSDAGIGVGGHGYGNHQFEYLTLPVLARFTYGEKVQFFFNAGLFAGFSISQKESVHGETYYPYAGGTTQYYEYTSKNIPDFNPVDFGLVGGIGIGIPIKKKWNVSLEIRDNMGLIKAISTSYYNYSMRTNTVTTLLGISYKLGFREK